MPKGFRKCKNCGVTFEKKRPLQSACSPICAFEWAKKLKEKKESKEWKERKREMQENLKTLSDYKKDLQVVFNKFIRLRDTGEPCISCGNPHPKKINAGHYKSVGSHPELRFEELNAHSQCEYCNRGGKERKSSLVATIESVVVGEKRGAAGGRYFIKQRKRKTTTDDAPSVATKIKLWLQREQ